MQWYYTKGGQQFGPIDDAELFRLVRFGELTPQDMLWNPTMGDKWALASTVGNIFSLPPRVTPPTPPLHDSQPACVSTAPSQASYAGFWLRFVAALIDCVILAVLGAIGGGICGAFLGGAMGVAGSDIQTITAVCSGFGYIIGLVINWLYFTLFESSSKQATWGKMAIGIRVTDLQGQRVSFARANGRYWGKIVSFITVLIGYVMVAFTQRKQGLHDIMAGCLVVRK